VAEAKFASERLGKSVVCCQCNLDETSSLLGIRDDIAHLRCPALNPSNRKEIELKSVVYLPTRLLASCQRSEETKAKQSSLIQPALSASYVLGECVERLGRKGAEFLQFINLSHRALSSLVLCGCFLLSFDYFCGPFWQSSDLPTSSGVRPPAAFTIRLTSLSCASKLRARVLTS